MQPMRMRKSFAVLTVALVSLIIFFQPSITSSAERNVEKKIELLEKNALFIEQRFLALQEGYADLRKNIVDIVPQEIVVILDSMLQFIFMQVTLAVNTARELARGNPEQLTDQNVVNAVQEFIHANEMLLAHHQFLNEVTDTLSENHPPAQSEPEKGIVGPI
ncbi:MAG: hypothetical protein G01um101448_1194 [Parcubacteria group bacterium Gr01-1014_48]|nr:MAG: hypothetical protein G01um101448_1194 [Parcubacteria group bacterium Gr01-1014_48]